MADVRLVATNPEDSSVVPVAANAKGELLCATPVIDEIPNDVVLDGKFIGVEGLGSYMPDKSTYLVSGPSNYPTGAMYPSFNELGVHLVAGGMADNDNKWLKFGDDKFVGGCSVVLDANNRKVYLCVSDEKNTGDSGSLTVRFQVSSAGPSSYRYFLEADPAKTEQRRIEVREELEFLRDQVRQVMERLKMVPEGGWEVWDGSTET